MSNIGESIRDLVNTLLKPVRQQISNMILRGFITMVQDSGDVQIIQTGVRKGGTEDDIENIQGYGHGSVPPLGLETILLSIGGDPGHKVCISVKDFKFRPKNRKSGDSFIYDDKNQIVVLTENGLEIILADRKKAFIAASEILLGSSTSSKKLVHADIVGLIKTEIAKCVCVVPAGGGTTVPVVFSGGPVNAFEDGWADAGLSAKAKTE